MSTNAREESVHLSTGRPPSLIDGPHAIYSFTTDETLARHQRLYHGLPLAEVLHSLPRKRAHKRAFHKMENYRRVDHQVLARYTHMDHSPCMA
jgi:hypothetical protein